VHTPGWDPDLFRTVLQEVMKRADLTQAEIGALAGRDRTQVNRWTRATNKPAYEAMRRLTGNIAGRSPELAELAQQLMSAAGYGDRVNVPDEPMKPAPEPATPYDDPDEAAIWRITTLSPVERRTLIGVLQALRTEAEGDAPSAKIEEFRRRA
jgi:transcriptional regulator with XRE-family HTH domain